MTAREMYEVWYRNVTDAEREHLDAFQEDANEITERFSLPLAFGTAGMRGLVGLGTFRMNIYTVGRATYGIAKYIETLGEEAKSRGVVIAYDTRRLSLTFASRVAKVLSAAKIRSYLFENVRPVPMCSFAVRHLGAVAGIMITASHNPKEYNGYKVYGEDGAQMGPEAMESVLKFIEENDDYFAVPEDDVQDINIKTMDGVDVNEYIKIIGRTVDEAYYAEVAKLTLSPETVKKYGQSIKLVYTPIHGAGYVPVATVLERMGLNVNFVVQQVLPDTEFSTVAVPNPENPSTLKMGMSLGNRIGADVVIGTDPDCDRMGLAVRDFKGEFRLLNGNQIGALLLDYILMRLKESGKLPSNGAVVKTIVTTTLADKIAESYGVKVFNVLTGFKFIGEKIKEWEESGEYTYLFGYEESYGYLRGTHARDKDAVVACMLTAEMACYYESVNKGLWERLNELFKKYGYYIEDAASIAYVGVGAMQDMAKAMKKVRDKTIRTIGGEAVEYVADYMKGVTVYADGRSEQITLPKSDVLKFGLADGQFVCIRPSGTEPKLKIYVLCHDKKKNNAVEKAQSLMEGMKKELE